MKKKARKLRLSTETLYRLDSKHLGYARGGTISADADCSERHCDAPYTDSCGGGCTGGGGGGTVLPGQ